MPSKPAVPPATRDLKTAMSDTLSGPMLMARDIPLGLVRALRHGQAEVWPGAWRADHVRVVEAATASKAAA